MGLKFGLKLIDYYFFCIFNFIKESKHVTIFTSKYSDKLQNLCDKLQYLQIVFLQLAN